MKHVMPTTLLLLVVYAVSLSAQWGKFQDPSVPRDAKGEVRMDAPAPRTADGKPDLSGNWMRADQEPLPSELAGLFGGGVVLVGVKAQCVCASTCRLPPKLAVRQLLHAKIEVHGVDSE